MTEIKWKTLKASEVTRILKKIFNKGPIYPFSDIYFSFWSFQIFVLLKDQTVWTVMGSWVAILFFSYKNNNRRAVFSWQ